MDRVVQWLLQVSWADLLIGTMAGFVAAVLLTMLSLHLRHIRSAAPEKGEHWALDERQQNLLYCGDIKALTDLAIQRHLTDFAFVQRFRAQPCYEILSPHFSKDFRERLARSRKFDGGKDLAAACREECERLERLWQGC